MAFSVSFSRDDETTISYSISNAYYSTSYDYDVQVKSNSSGNWIHKAYASIKSTGKASGSISVNDNSAYYCRVAEISSSGTVYKPSSSGVEVGSYTPPTPTVDDPYWSSYPTLSGTSITQGSWKTGDSYSAGSGRYACSAILDVNGNIKAHKATSNSSGTAVNYSVTASDLGPRTYYVYIYTSSSNSSSAGPFSDYTVTISDDVWACEIKAPEVKYTYYLRYDANGGSGTMTPNSFGPTTQTSIAFSVKSCSFTRTNYRFIGWATSSSGSVSYQPRNDYYLYYNDPDDTLYAKWEYIPQYTYYLRYDANGGSGSMTPSSFGPTTQTYIGFVVKECAFTRSNYQFTGWATSASGSVAYQPREDYYLYYDDPDDTLYAKWTRLYTYYLRYDANGGSGTMTPSSFGPTTQTRVGFSVKSNGFTKNGYRFLGWATSPTGSVAYQPRSDYYLTSSDTDDTLYAKWELIPTYTYTLSYNGNGATGNVPSQQSSGTTTEPYWYFTVSNTIPTWDSKHTFLYWQDENGNHYTGGNSISATIEVPNRTLTAIWQRDTISNFTWTGSDSTDNNLFQQNKDISTALKASRWNNLKAKISTVASKTGGSYSYTEVVPYQGIGATEFNNVLSAIGKLPHSGSGPNSVQQGDSIKYQYYVGSNSLKQAINDAIYYYNNF